MAQTSRFDSFGLIWARLPFCSLPLPLSDLHSSSTLLSYIIIKPCHRDVVVRVVVVTKSSQSVLFAGHNLNPAII